GAGEMVIVVDDADRENEGDLIMAAEYATADKIAFFLNHTSGVICIPLTGDRLDALDLPPMVSENTESQRTAFTVSVDHRHGRTTGISASDRAATIAALIDPATRPADLARPGHTFPLRYREGGVLKRGGHTEATLDLARMAGLYPAGVLCEIVSEDKTGMARLEELERFAKKHGLLLISIADVIRYRRRPGRCRVPPRPRGPGHRHRSQAARLQPAGARARHPRRQPRAGLPCRQPRVRHRRPDSRRPRHHHHAAPHQQPRQVRWSRGI